MDPNYQLFLMSGQIPEDANYAPDEFGNFSCDVNDPVCRAAMIAHGVMPPQFADGPPPDAGRGIGNVGTIGGGGIGHGGGVPGAMGAGGGGAQMGSQGAGADPRDDLIRRLLAQLRGRRGTSLAIKSSRKPDRSLNPLARMNQNIGVGSGNAFVKPSGAIQIG